MRLDFTEIKNLQDAFKMLLNNEFLSDIKFKFADGRIIFAHSFVLCCRSNEFCDSFEATIGAAKLIEVQNFTYEEYYEFFQYLYTDSCEFDYSTTTNVIQLSQTHDLAELEKRCTDFMLNNMDIENACEILEKSIEFELDTLKTEVNKFIAENYLASLNTESFLEIDNKTLKEILELEPVSDVDEFKIFVATMKWAERACVKDGLESSGSNKRHKLGVNLKLLRFGAMTLKEFSNCHVMEPDLFTKEEIIDIYLNFTTGKKNSYGFSDKKRLNVRQSDTVHLFPKNNASSLTEYRNKFSEYTVVFSVSHPISIEHIKWYCYEIQLIRITEAPGTVVYKGKFIDDLYKSNLLLKANTRYSFTVSLKLHSVKLFHTNVDIITISDSGKCAFSVYNNSAKIISDVKFKIK